MSGTAPEEWFLSASQIRVRPVHTSGNAVRALIDGSDYLARLADRLAQVGSGGYVHLAGWRVTPTARLHADVAGAPTLEEILTALSDAGALVRALLWYVPGTVGGFGAGHGAENLRVARLVEQLGHEAVLDDRLPSGTFASHHQKFLVLGSGTTTTAFVGGLDIALDRWDNPAHDEPAGRQRELFDAWHDVQAQVEGPAAAQLWDSFAERWNDPRTPNGTVFTPGNSPSTPIPAAQRPAEQVGVGTCHVQILHTYPCRSTDHTASAENDEFPFAPDGDRSYERGLVRAIGSAEHFVYVEDQYLWPCAVVDALTAAVGRGVVVIAVLTNNYDVPGLVPYHNFLRASAIDQIRAAGAGRLHTFHLEQDDGDDIYVHAKTIVIDDRYAVIGTANVNRRSMSTDTEIAIAVVDAAERTGPMRGAPLQVGRFARDYRMRLWEEHLGVEVEDPLTAAGAPRGFPDATPGSKIGHVVRHRVKEPRFCHPPAIPFVLMNPETLCPS